MLKLLIKFYANVLLSCRRCYVSITDSDIDAVNLKFVPIRW